MGKVRIRRSNRWYGGVRDYKIFLDNQKIGEVGKGDAKEFDSIIYADLWKTLVNKTLTMKKLATTIVTVAQAIDFKKSPLK